MVQRRRNENYDWSGKWTRENTRGCKMSGKKEIMMNMDVIGGGYSMKRVCLLIVSIVASMCLMLELSSCGSNKITNSFSNNNDNNKITINNESFSFDEFGDILSHDTRKANRYVGQKAIVTGRISDLKENLEIQYSSSRFYFDGAIILNSYWYFKVSPSVLDNYEVGDIITIEGEISTYRGRDVYCYIDNTILTK